MWFPSEQPEAVVIALIGGDKKVIQDLWYDSATPRAEAAVDQWIRQQAVTGASEQEDDNEEDEQR